MNRTTRIILGLLVSLIIIGGGFYFFMFVNPMRLHQVNLLKWIPILLCTVALFAAGKINKDTPIVYLPVLFIPFVIFDLFNFFYFPFILVLILTGVLTLIVTRAEAGRTVKVASSLSLAGFLMYYLLSQPIIFEKQNFGRSVDGELVNATVWWNPLPEGLQELPEHTLTDRDGEAYTLSQEGSKPRFIAFWATWCGPCIEKKPELDSLKRAYAGNIKFIDISLDEDKSEWRKFLQEHHPAGMQLISDNVNKTRRELSISSLPLYFVVNLDGEYNPSTTFEKAREILDKSFE